jgi:hypothetical protein
VGKHVCDDELDDVRLLARSAPPMYLTDDEIITAKAQGDLHPFRVRVWRAEGQPAVVLASQATYSATPASWATCRIANLVHRTFLGYNVHGMIYFESERAPKGGPRLEVCRFSYCGCPLRPAVLSAVRVPAAWSAFRRLVADPTFNPGES